MTLQEYIDSLPKGKQFELAIKLTKLILPIWAKYSEENELSYRDTVVGLAHKVDKELLQNTVKAVEKHLSLDKWKKFMDGKSTLLKLRVQFDDPVVALQDTDWELPDEVLKTFYAVYNLIDAIIGKEQTTFGDSTIYVSINQAADALESSKTMTFDQIHEVIYGSKNGR
jgi:hypothetical protein